MSKILIAEDDAVVREILAATVESMGHVPLLSPNGRHALETLECDPLVALVITDMAMPEMGGRELIEATRGLFASRPRPAPILIMSGVVAPREIADLLDQGAEAFLAKPIHLAEFCEYVKRVLPNSKDLEELAR